MERSLINEHNPESIFLIPSRDTAKRQATPRAAILVVRASSQVESKRGIFPVWLVGSLDETATQSVIFQQAKTLCDACFSSRLSPLFELFFNRLYYCTNNMDPLPLLR